MEKWLTLILKELTERFGMDPGAVLDNVSIDISRTLIEFVETDVNYWLFSMMAKVVYARVYTYEHQYNLLLGLAAKISEEPFRLLIVDSVIALFRVDFTGREELAKCQVYLEIAITT
ncbi:meiotic recombination protein DMC1 homolog isoform X1 [Durio zibethinus]|uniref:Meiotic recombination protein DMC1 homolog isoform X1 n=1 Tax=Durio zibethinus TaxID=66656 RepID=A0A6P5Y5Z3_DURZI|nr:meiotic recombination protein DMC1 homolog isoform X1 [Durio zibethinus]